MGLKLGGGVALQPGMTRTGTTTVMRPSAKVTTPISTFSFSGSSVPCGPLPCAHRVLGYGTAISTFSFSGSSVPCGPLPCAHRVSGYGTAISTFSSSSSSVPCGPLPYAHRVSTYGCLQASGGGSSNRSPRPKAHCMKGPSMSVLLTRRHRKALKQFHLTMRWPPLLYDIQEE